MSSSTSEANAAMRPYAMLDFSGGRVASASAEAAVVHWLRSSHCAHVTLVALTV